MGADGSFDGLAVTMTRDAAGVIISVGPEIERVLGWAPEELVGRPSTELIHPEDQPTAISTWFSMLDAPGERRTWQGRYRTGHGTWQWVETVNVSHLDHPADPHVRTTMRPADREQVSLSEALRAREQLLSRLSEAMPIGVFQIDAGGTVTFCNERLRAILGSQGSATVSAQFAAVVPADQAALAEGLERVLEDRPVDDLELRIAPPSGTGAVDDERVCVVSMRPLTDGNGGVTGAVGCVVDVTEQVQLRRQLEVRATTDQLTSCLNRGAILEVLATAVAREPGAGLAVIFVDLCRFKDVNDRFGHAAGDRVLEVAAARLRSVVREGDRVGRFGGDEFLVVCPGVDGEPGALEIAERIRAALTACLELAGGNVDLLASIGVVWSREPLDPDTLVSRADQAMYRAKRAGSSAVEVFARSA
ncbi:MAG: sensor domain-containing diguanylate cyclase [Acidimicrobiales bacterium]